jgi:hypothetical protein
LLPLAPCPNSTNPSVVEHDGPDDQRDGAEDYHADGNALIAELLIQPARFFYCLGWFSKAEQPLNECSETDNQHADASNHGLRIAGERCRIQTTCLWSGSFWRWRVRLEYEWHPHLTHYRSLVRLAFFDGLHRRQSNDIVGKSTRFHQLNISCLAVFVKPELNHRVSGLVERHPETLANLICQTEGFFAARRFLCHRNTGGERNQQCGAVLQDLHTEVSRCSQSASGP